MLLSVVLDHHGLPPPPLRMGGGMCADEAYSRQSLFCFGLLAQADDMGAPPDVRPVVPHPALRLPPRPAPTKGMALI